MKKYLVLALVLTLLLVTACSSEGNDNAIEQENQMQENAATNEEDKEGEDITNAETVSGEETEETDDETYPAPDFELEDLDGNMVKLSDFLGKKVIINFWATWCPYCVDEMPDFMKLQETYAEDLVILFVAVGEDKDKVSTFVEENGLTGKFLLDIDTAVGSTYGARGLPMTFAVDDEGDLVTYFTGKMPYEIMEEMYGMIE